MSYLEYKVAADLGYLSRIYLMNPTIDSKLETITLPYEDINSSFEALRSMSLELFPEIENSDYTISYLPESLEVSGNLAYYLNPPIDLPSRNVIRVNKSETDSDVLTLWTTLSHEGFPGHLYQTQYYRENISQYPLESLLENIGTSEGWAFYVERLALDWADIDSTFADYFWYNQTINMGLSAILDIGINYEGWDLTDLSDYIANYYGELEQADLQELYNSLASDPGIFLPYAVGYYQMDDLFKAIKNNYSCDSDMYVAFFKHSMLPFMLLNQYLGSDGSI